MRRVFLRRLVAATIAAWSAAYAGGPVGGRQAAYAPIRSVQAEAGGFFAGDASASLDLIAIGAYVTGDPTRPGQPAPARPRGHITFFNAEGDVLARTAVGGSVWALAMTPDGSRTVAGSDDEKLYVFNRTTLVASGVPVAGDTALRGVAVRNDGRFAGVGGTWFTLHDLTAIDPIRPIYTDTTPTQVRAVAFSANGRYAAYGGWNNVEANRQGAPPTTYLAVYDIQTRQRVFSHHVQYAAGTTAEIRHLSISSDGNRIVAGNWAYHLLYYVRTDPNSTTWELKQDIEMSQRVYWTAIDPTDSMVIVGEQAALVQAYAIDDEALTLLWEKREMDGGPRTVGISPDGSYVTATTRGGCGEGRGGQFLVWSRTGEAVFAGRTADVDLACAASSTQAEAWFGAVSESGGNLVFSGWGGQAFFYRLAVP